MMMMMMIIFIMIMNTMILITTMLLLMMKYTMIWSADDNNYDADTNYEDTYTGQDNCFLVNFHIWMSSLL